MNKMIKREKKQWVKPALIILDFKNTSGGAGTDTEGVSFAPDTMFS